MKLQFKPIITRQRYTLVVKENGITIIHDGKEYPYTFEELNEGEYVLLDSPKALTLPLRRVQRLDGVLHVELERWISPPIFPDLPAPVNEAAKLTMRAKPVFDAKPPSDPLGSIKEKSLYEWEVYVNDQQDYLEHLMQWAKEKALFDQHKKELTEEYDEKFAKWRTQLNLLSVEYVEAMQEYREMNKDFDILIDKSDGFDPSKPIQLSKGFEV